MNILMYQIILKDIYQGTSQITYQSNPSDALHVPDEIDLLDTHGSNTSSRTNDEDATTRTSTVGQHLPEVVVHWEAVHTHGTSHQRHIVHDAGEDTDDDVNQEVLAWFSEADLVETTSQHGEVTADLQHAYCHQDTQEEKNGIYIDLWKDV